VDGLRLAATEIGDRIALALQALGQERGVDVRRPLLRIDYRPEAAAAPFRFDMAGGKLHRTGCPAIPRASSQALYSVWDPGEGLPALACEKCQPVAIESAHMRQDSSLDIIYGFLSIVDQFGSVLRERGREYRNSRRGKRLAKDLMFTGRTLSAEEALQFGLVNRVAATERYLDDALKLAEEIAARAPLAVRAAKKMVDQAFELSLNVGLRQERQEFYNLFATDDQKEGMKAFKEKRKPVFTGK